MAGPYDEELGRELDSSDVEHDVNNGYLQESSLSPGTYLDGDGNRYDGDYNPLN